MVTKRSAVWMHAIALLMAGAPMTDRLACAQSEAGMRTSALSAVNYNITAPVEQLEMVVKSSRILTLDRQIPKFQVHNEQIVRANPIAHNQIQISATQPGVTQLNLWDADENLYTIDVTVVADAREVEGVLATLFPSSSLRVTPVGRAGAAVTGTVTSVDDVDKVVQIVEQFYAQVINNVKVVGVQQILLHTKIMEVSRTKFRELGIDWALSDPANATGMVVGPGGLISAPGSNFSTLSPIAFQANTRVGLELGSMRFDSLIAALRQNDLVKVLAEPTVIAEHGRPARFIVGGKVPYIVPAGVGAVTVRYEEFGTSVDFLPFVVGPGRIRLEVRPEVSEPDPTRSLLLDGTNVPGFRSRYVETAVEMRAGQTFAIAGLLQTRVETTSRGVPFFGELPYMGALFRRIEESHNEIELLVTVTPQLADAMDPHEVPPGGPGLNSDSPTDHEFYLRGYMEVPRTDALGDCLPRIPGAMHDYPYGVYPPMAGAPGMEAPGAMLEESMAHGAAPQGAVAPHGAAPHGALRRGPPSAGAPHVLPTPEGVQVAPGVTIMAPERSP